MLERIGLALTGASCGLFVAAHVGRADIDLIGSAAAVFAMMIYGAAGFYLGIDLPHALPDHNMHLPLRHGLGTKTDAVELLSAPARFSPRSQRWSRYPASCWMKPRMPLPRF